MDNLYEHLITNGTKLSFGAAYCASHLTYTTTPTTSNTSSNSPTKWPKSRKI